MQTAIMAPALLALPRLSMVRKGEKYLLDALEGIKGLVPTLWQNQNILYANYSGFFVPMANKL